ncbi:MAG: hypothetical protein ABIH72_04725 [archaeon]
MAKKKFLEVQIPLIKTEIKVLAEEPKDVEGRNIKLDLTRQLRGKSIEATFKIKIEDKKLVAETIRLLVMPYFIRRMMRKSTSYVEDSFETDAKDYKIRIKTLLITRKKVHRSVRKALRIATKEYLMEYVRDKKTEEIFSEIISSRLQKPMSQKLKKIYPLGLCEIRDIKKVGKQKPETEVKTEKID